jgi:beta-lactamase class A
MRSIICPILLILVFGSFSFAQKSKTSSPVIDVQKQRLEQEIFRLSLISGGVVGVTAIHIESGKRISQNGQMPFPMASSYKVPIAIQLLAKVDSGKLALDQLIEIRKSDLHPGSGMISERFNWPNTENPGVSLSVRSLLELMLLISDNSATDVCLRLAGGQVSVNACMKRLGINGIRIDRPTAWLISQYLGMNIPTNQSWDPSLFDTLAKKLKPEEEKMAARKFDEDIQDTSLPDAMSDLLLKLYTQPILKPASKELLLDIMKRCETGLTRLKGALPPETVVMHKTGTIGMTTNDVGIITLPGDAGHVVVSLFVKSSEKEIPQRERAIAEITRSLYDYFLLMR